MTGMNGAPSPKIDHYMIFRVVGIVWGAAAGALIVAKLLGFVHLSWLAVTAPVWGPVAIVIIIFIVTVVSIRRAEASGGNPFQ